MTDTAFIITFSDSIERVESDDTKSFVEGIIVYFSRW